MDSSSPRDFPPLTEPTPHDRMATVAAILARGVMRMKQTLRDAGETTSKEVVESSDLSLESVVDPSVTGSQRSGF